jgi:hypothetical protein
MFVMRQVVFGLFFTLPLYIVGLMITEWGSSPFTTPSRSQDLRQARQDPA